MTALSPILKPTLSPVLSSSFGGGSGASSLLTGLVSWWSFNEASGTRVDLHGNNDLTDNNTVTQAVGKIGNAAQFTAANQESLSKSSPSGLGGGNRDFTCAVWAYGDTWQTSDATIIDLGSLTDPNASVRDYLLVRSGASKKYTFWLTSGANWYSVSADSFGVVPAGVFHLIIHSYDATANESSISVNDGPVDVTAGVPAPNNSGEPFRFGRYASQPNNYFDGRMDIGAFWSRLLIPDEKTEYFNSGAAKAYPG